MPLLEDVLVLLQQLTPDERDQLARFRTLDPQRKCS